MSTLVIDASVALKLVLNEHDSEVAERIAGTHDLCAPEFMLLECGNGLWSAARRKLISATQANASLANIAGSKIEWFETQAYVRSALDIALEIDRTIYDSLYLALAISIRSTVVTADMRFAVAAEAHTTYRNHVRRLGD